MHISFTAHKASGSSSSSNLIEYLDKENQLSNMNQDIKSNEKFFDSNYSALHSDEQIKSNDVINNLDNNRGSQKLNSSNFFMLNVSPSKDELLHMEKIALDELQMRGIIEGKNEASKLYYSEQKDELMKMQMKLYTKDLMNEYANNFDREIYVDENKLPNESEKKLLNKETDEIFNKFLKENNIEIKDNPNSNTDKKEWINVNNIKIKDENNKSYLVEMDLKEKGKAEVFLPKTTLHIQKDGSYKLPKDLYENKEMEVINKNIMVEVDYKFKSNSELKINGEKQIVLNFGLKDERFKEELNFSINEKDLKNEKGKYYVSQHLLNEKKEYALKNGIEKEFNQEREKIYKSVAEKKGFDLSKRPLTGDDLMWYGKVETNRTYKHNDKAVIDNKSTLKKIENLKKEIIGSRFGEIKKLESQLHKDSDGKIIEEGKQKAGNQYHVHVVVSRHDKTMKNPRNKISLSPLANAKESNMQNGAKVGFNRNNFFEKAEKVFDQKFDFKRPIEKSYENYKNAKASNKTHKSSGVSSVANNAKSQTKQFLMKHTGLNSIKQHISPLQTIKNEIGIANIPSKLPTSFRQVAVKVVKKIISQGLEH